MKKILGILTITLVLAACDKEQTNIHVVDEQNFSEYIEDIEKKLIENEVFINQFIEESLNKRLNEETLQKMLELLEVKNINFDRLNELNILNNVEAEISYYKTNRDFYRVTNNCDRLIEIRDALLDECDRYPALISDYCGGAVMLAYWWKSRGC